MRAGLLVVLIVASLPASAAAAWTPEHPQYNVGKQSNVPVTLSDGTVLRANVFYPTDAGGAPAGGQFPVIMVQTPYGKDTVGAASGSEGGAEAGTQTAAMPYFVRRGYIDVVAEVRGTGDSGGTFGLLDPIQGSDGSELVQWAAHLPHSNGRVGLYGPSYMGLDQFMTANAVAPNSALKAIFPIVAGNDTYRDAAFDGGLLDSEFDLAAITTIFGPLNLVNPVAENPADVADLLKVETQHAPQLLSYNLDQISNISSGGDQAYDEDYWQTRAPRNMLARVVQRGIPAFMVGGWFDLYQRGSPLDYSGLQNAHAGRPVSSPMAAGQKASGRYQLLQGPWYHLDAGTGFDIYSLELAWFDRWLKDEPTGIDQTSKPLHVYAVGANRWLDASRYPFGEAHPRTYYFAAGPSASGAPSVNDGRLEAAAPVAVTGSDPVLYNGASSACAGSSDQWGAGALALTLELGQLPPNPCAKDDRSIQAGTGALTYTTAPLTADTMIAGPIDTTVYATSTRPDVELVATVEDVGPDGASVPLTSGALLGSLRALEDKLSWAGSDGRPQLPYHPYTRASATPVPVGGSVSRFDVEVRPILARIAAGHRVRLTLTTSDSPHLLPIPVRAADLVGGVYAVQRNTAAASYLELPLASPSAFSDTGLVAGSVGPAAKRSRPRRCASRRSVKFELTHARHARVVRVDVFVNGRRELIRRGRNLRAIVISRLPQGPFTLKVVSTQSKGAMRSKLVSRRSYGPCTCTAQRSFRFKLHHARHARVVRVDVFVNGQRKLTRRGHNLRVLVLRRPRERTLRIRIVSTQSTGSKIISTRTYRPCAKSGPRIRARHHRSPKRRTRATRR